MSWRASRWAIALDASSGITPQSKMVLMVLAHFAERETNVVHLPLDALARLACIKRRMVRRYVGQLISAGLIELVREATGGRRRFNQYRVLVPADFATNGAGVGGDTAENRVAHDPVSSESGSYATPFSSERRSCMTPFSSERGSYVTPFRAQTGSYATPFSAERGSYTTPKVIKKEEIREREKKERGALARARAREDSLDYLINAWKAGEEARKYATDCGLDPDRAAVDFVVYVRSRSDLDKYGPDWDANFQNWCRREAQFRRHGGGGRPPVQNRLEAQRDRVLAKIEAEAAAKKRVLQ